LVKEVRHQQQGADADEQVGSQELLKNGKPLQQGIKDKWTALAIRGLKNTKGKPGIETKIKKGLNF
jgi:hypothetical protein